MKKWTLACLICLVASSDAGLAGNEPAKGLCPLMSRPHWKSRSPKGFWWTAFNDMLHVVFETIGLYRIPLRSPLPEPGEVIAAGSTANAGEHLAADAEGLSIIVSVPIGKQYPLGLLVVQNGDAPEPPDTGDVNGYESDGSTQFEFVNFAETLRTLLH